MTIILRSHNSCFSFSPISAQAIANAGRSIICFAKSHLSDYTHLFDKVPQSFVQCLQYIEDKTMSFAVVTLSGTLSLVDSGIIYIQPEAKDAPSFQVTSYGATTERLKALIGREVVITGQIKHFAHSKTDFAINAEEVWINQSWGEPKSLVSLVGRFSDKYADFSYVGDKQTPCFKFGVSYATQHKNDQNKPIYFNWQVKTFGKTAENIKKYFTDGKTIAIPSANLIWYSKEDKDSISGTKTYLSVNANNFAFVGGKGE